MRKKITVFLVIVAIVYIGYKVDKTFYMPKRVRSYTWEYSHGYYAGDYINPERYVIRNDTLFFSGGRLARIRYQYFDDLVISNPANNQTGTYEKDWLSLE